MTERNITLDNAKGIGILLVIAGHLFARDSYPFMYIFAFHMPLFFIISGYVFSPDKYANFITCLKISYARYLKPYFAFNVIGFFLAMPVIVGGVIIGKYSVSQLVVKCLYEVFWKINPFIFFMGSLWFLVVLFFSVVLGWQIIKMRSRFLSWRFGLYFLLSIMSYSLFLFQKGFFMPDWIQESLPLKMASIPICTMFFLVGYELRIFQFKFTLNFLTFFAIAIVAVLIPINGFVNISTPFFGNIILFILNALLGSYVVLTISSVSMPKFISWIGQNSLVIFSMHGVWLFVYTQLLKYFCGYEIIPISLCLLGTLLISALSWPTVKVTKPVLNYLLNKI